MKAQTVTKLNNLLNIGLPKRLHQDRSHHDLVEYISNDHIIGVVAIIGTGDDHVRFDGEHEHERLDLRPAIGFNKDSPGVILNRERLLEIISNLDSEQVQIKFKDESPVLIKGQVEDCIIECVMAPIIKGDDE